MSDIVLTGAGGEIGTALRAGASRAEETWRLLDIQAVEAPAAHERTAAVDLGDFDATRQALSGADAVIHLAAQSSETAFADICRDNLVATYNVFEAARRSGVRRVIFASSMHVTGFYPWATTVAPDTPFRPDSLYGVSKVYGEAMGRLYADKYGMEVIALRIGHFIHVPDRPADLSIWLSPADCARLFRACLDVPSVSYLALYGVSANSSRLWTEDGWETIGYRPEDDAHEYRNELTGPTPYWQGMEFTEPGFGRS